MEHTDIKAAGVKAGTKSFVSFKRNKVSMRPDEVFPMRIENIYWDQNRIWVPEGKTDNATRFVPMSDRMKTMLRAWCGSRTEGWVFPSSRSKSGHLTTIAKGLQHAPSWQLTFAKEPAGEIVRALAWAGPERVQEVLKEIERKVPWSELHKVNQHISLFPIWMARALCQSDSYTATVKT